MTFSSYKNNVIWTRSKHCFLYRLSPIMLNTHIRMISYCRIYISHNLAGVFASRVIISQYNMVSKTSS